MVPAGVETEALDITSDDNEEAGFRDDSTLEETQDVNGSTLLVEAKVELAKRPCKFNSSIIFILIY